MPIRRAFALPVTLLVVAVVGIVGRAPVARAGVATVVDVTEDTFDGSCSDGDCSLRDAIRSAPDGGIVHVPSGFYSLSRRGDGGVALGDLNLRRSVTIVGTGETGAFIDATNLGMWAFTVGVRGVTATLRNLAIFGVRDCRLGAGVAVVDRGTLILDRVTVTGGRAAAAGGIFVGPTGTALVDRSLFLDNRAAEGRAGGLYNAGTAMVRRSAFVGNRAAHGGAIWNGGGADLTLANSTLSGNTATAVGGGIKAYGSVDIRGVTVSGNAAAIGGGIARPAGPANVVTVRNTIVAGNRASERGAECSTALESLGHNLERRGGCGFDAAGDRSHTDPLLGPLVSNGGPTPTRALRASSPAIDRGGPCAPKDQRGAPRDDRCDIGAYERVLCLGRAVNIVGTPGADDLTGGRGNDVFLGLGGRDVLQGSLGDDRMCGNGGGDALTGARGVDRIAGGSGDDRLRGEEGNDRLNGGSGTDRCVGGPGRHDRARRCEETAGLP